MTLVSGPLSTVTTEPSAVAQVNISINAPRTRGAGVMTPEVKTVAVTGGDFSSQIAPGPAVLSLLIGGRESVPIPILVDDIPSQTLANAVNAAKVATSDNKEWLEKLAAEVIAGTQGPMGEPGPAGPKGDPGDKGDPGATGSLDLIDESVQTTIDTVVVPAIEGARDEALGQVVGAVTAEVDALTWNRGIIPDGTDLNTLRTSGMWVVPTPEKAATLVNAPSALPGILTVASTSGVSAATQEYVGIPSAAGRPLENFRRGTVSASSWQAWGPLGTGGGSATIPESWGVSTNAIPTSLNFNQSQMRIEIAASAVRIISGASTVLLKAQQVTIPTANTFYRVETNRSGDVTVTAHNQPRDPDTIPFGFVWRSGATLQVYQIDTYAVDGKVPDTKPVTRGEIVAQLTGAALNFDFISGNLVIAGSSVRFVHGQKTAILVGQTVPLPTPGGAFERIVVNADTRVVKFAPMNYVLGYAEVQVGLINAFTKKIDGIAAYHVNGQPAGVERVALESIQYPVVSGAVEPNFELAEPLPEYDTFLQTATHTDVYALYDQLMADHPDWVTRTSLGVDGQGATIYRYDFRPPVVESSGQSDMVPKIILFSGVHGAEKAGIMTLFFALREIAQSWQTHPSLETLRWQVHFIVVPVAVPYGFNNMTRHNENNVDCARNFTAEWTLGTPGTETYGGPSPLSEVQTQYMDAIMSANRDAIYAASFHNFFNGADILWNAGATRFGVGLAKSWITRQTLMWRKKYAWMPTTRWAGYASYTAPPGSEGKQATLVHGIQGGTIEINRQIEASPDASPHSSLTATLGTEAFINWLILNLREGIALKRLRT